MILQLSSPYTDYPRNSQPLDIVSKWLAKYSMSGIVIVIFGQIRNCLLGYYIPVLSLSNKY